MPNHHDPSDGRGYDDDRAIDARDDGHECQRNTEPDTDEPGLSSELWKRTYSCAYHGCSRTWTEWYAPVFDEGEGWPADHDCPYDGNDRVPDLELDSDAAVVDELPDTSELIIEGTCYFCGEDDVQVRFELDSTDAH